jgi:hypothetical protein
MTAGATGFQWPSAFELMTRALAAEAAEYDAAMDADLEPEVDADDGDVDAWSFQVLDPWPGPRVPPGAGVSAASRWLPPGSFIRRR